MQDLNHHSLVRGNAIEPTSPTRVTRPSMLERRQPLRLIRSPTRLTSVDLHPSAAARAELSLLRGRILFLPRYRLYSGHFTRAETTRCGFQPISVWVSVFGP